MQMLYSINLLFKQGVTMTIAYWCILSMLIYPYIFTALAKSSRNYNNQDPRKYLETVTGWRKRALNVQLNCFEATPAFGIAVIVAHLIKGNQNTINILALIFVFSRLCYAFCYLTNKARLRSLFWFIGMSCIIGLFFTGA
jgi:uncharacterized MAPEG superfamily protein